MPPPMDRDGRARAARVVCAVAVAWVLSAISGWPLEVAPDPDEIEGLEAWWRADALDADLANGAPVILWPDETPNGHDLTAPSGGAPTYLENQVGGRPVVGVNAGPMSMAKPFNLGEHTIFVVYRVLAGSRKAFFHGSRDSFGVLLRRGDNAFDTFQNGNTKPGNVIDYATATPPAKGYRITVLAREGSTMRSWVDGEDVSSRAEFSGDIEVGAFFFLRQTAYVKSTGNGLQIAEMLFYDRFLTDLERESVTAYLATQYGLAVTSTLPVDDAAVFEPAEVTGLAQLSTDSRVDVNGTGVTIPWSIEDELDGPFEHDSEISSSRLVCTEDRTRIRLYVSLPLTTSVDGANIRVLFRVNGGQFLRGEGRSGNLGVGGGPHRGSVRAEVIATLDDGDYVEVVTLRAGAEGPVTLDPEAAVFIAEVK